MKNALAKISHNFLDTQQNQYSIFNLLDPSHHQTQFTASSFISFHDIHFSLIKSLLQHFF